MDTMIEVSEKKAFFGEIPCAAAVFSYSDGSARLTWANDKFFSLFGSGTDQGFPVLPGVFQETNRCASGRNMVEYFNKKIQRGAAR